MLKTMLYDLTKSFVKSDCKTIVFHGSSDGKLRVSSTTDDKQLYIFAESIDNSWNEKEFAFRDWNAITSIISSFYDHDNPEKCSITLEKDSEDYPILMKIKNGRMKMTHYLQNYTIIARQEQLLSSYKGKKFQLKEPSENYIETFDSNDMRNISKLSSLTSEKLFRIGIENKELYFYFGDESKTIDNAKICVCENYDYPYAGKDLYFSVDYLNIAFNSLKNHDDVKLKIDNSMIVLSGKNDVSNKIIAIIGKKNV